MIAAHASSPENGTKRLPIAAASAVLVVVVALALLCLGPTEAHAEGQLGVATAPKGANVTGKANKVTIYSYGSTAPGSRYDVTGDGLADEVSVSVSLRDYGSPSRMTVKVNGKQALSVSDKRGVAHASIDLVTLRNGKPFVFVNLAGPNNGDGTYALYQYRGSALKAVTSQAEFDAKGIQSGHPSITNVAVSGNSVKVTYGYMTFFVGGISIQQTWNYDRKSSTLKKAGSSTSAIKYWNTKSMKNGKPKVTAVKAFKVHTDTSLKKAKFTVKKNSKVKLVAAASKKGKLYFKVQSSKKSGWVKSKGLLWPNPYVGGTTWFKECMLAG